MRIALIIQHANPSLGGAERYTADVARSLAHRGHDVELIASTFSDDVPWEVRRVHLSAAGPTRLLKYMQFVRHVDDHVIGTPYDIVHAMLPVRRCNVYHPHAGIEAEMLATAHLKHAGLRRKLATIGGRFNFKRHRVAAVERELLTSSRPPLVLCLSGYVRQTVLKHYTLDARHLATLHNGIDLKRFDPDAIEPSGEIRQRLGIGESKVAALIVAQDFARKGVAEAIRAVGKIRDSRLVLIVVGRDNAGPYQKLVKEAGANERVFFAGAASDPRPYYRESDFFVLPTRHDPCSLVVLEALVMGLPVISTRFNGSTELMGNEKHGFILDDPADVDALAAAMKQMLDQPQRALLARACLKLRPRLSYEHHLEQLLQLYQTRVPVVDLAAR